MIRTFAILSGVVGLLAGAAVAAGRNTAPRTAFDTLGAEYSRDVKPVLRQYCLGCHSTAKPAGELDLQQFATLQQVRKAPGKWLKVVEMLDNGEMPPKTAKQPTAGQRAALRGWVERYLHAEALAAAGDPGPVVLRRLNNAEYTYTVRDLTGIEDLDPAREFPTDSAAGEGFTNTGNSLVMSPALLTKYFDAGKEIAKHAELLPDGFRFSPYTTRNDWTNDLLDQIRTLYKRHTDSGGASTVNLQGIVFNTNDGGRLPVEKYLAATLAERDALQAGRKTLAGVAREHGLNEKYLRLLWGMLNDPKPSPLFTPLRARWREAKPGDAPALAGRVGMWQKALWRFATVGHIGRAGGPKAWQEPVVPVAASREVRLKLAEPTASKDVTLYLTTRDAGDGAAGDFAVWGQPRLVAPGRPDLPLRDLRRFTQEMTARRERLFRTTAKALAAAAEARGREQVNVAQLAAKHEVDPETLSAWLEYLGIGSDAPPKLAHFRAKQTNATYPFIKSWESPDLPILVANSSDQQVRIPGIMKPHGVCVHPTPTLSACVGWQSPLSGPVRIEGKVTHAHPECGNGVTWALEVRRGGTRRRLAAGVAQGSATASFGPIAALPVERGDLVSLVIGPRDGNHSCDLTDVELTLKSAEPQPREWSLTRDITPDVHAGNPHADRFGNAEVWHFYSEPVSGADAGPVIPAGSLLARWDEAGTAAERSQLGAAVQQLLLDGPPADGKSPDAALYRQLSALGGPLLARAWRQVAASGGAAPVSGTAGLDPSLFGKHPSGAAVDPLSLCVQAPSVVEVRIPAELAAGAELVVTTGLHPESGAAGSVQMQALLERPSPTGLVPDAPVLALEGSAPRKRLEQAFDEFRALFPIALAYTKIVPVDEVVTLVLFYREDEALRRLMLSDAESAELDRLWSELRWVSQSPLKLVNAYEQISEFATQDAPAMVEALKPLKPSIYAGSAAFQKEVVAAEPRQVERLIEFAARAYRRPLTAAEGAELRDLYRRLRQEELPHEEAFRLTLARIFVSPAFLYRLEKAPAGPAPAPVSDWELASRLSYFLWSSPPDDQLRAAAAAGKLRQPDVLSAQARRMLKGPKIRRLATEFACQWLHIYEFDTLNEKSEQHFPEFAALRKDMYEEAIRFFTDQFQRDASVLSFFDADSTWVNERLARFYGLPGVTGEEWRRVEGIRAAGRGGLLGLSATLAKQSGASRTSPILRGTWVSEVLLGEKLPKPPKDVPLLPEDETAIQGLTVRELTAKHTSDPKCSGCHQKIDPFGFSLEGFDAIGRRRTVDLANRPIDARTQTPDGHPIDGLAGLRDYLLRTRRQTVLRQFCRKLLGYALGRATQLSDEPLLAEMQQQLPKNGYRFSTAVDLIVRSPQFRNIRGGGGSVAAE